MMMLTVMLCDVSRIVMTVMMTIVNKQSDERICL